MKTAYQRNVEQVGKFCKGRLTSVKAETLMDEAASDVVNASYRRSLSMALAPIRLLHPRNFMVLSNVKITL